MSTGSCADGEPTHQCGNNNHNGGGGHRNNDGGDKARCQQQQQQQQQTTDKSDGAAMTAPKFSQKISILVFRGAPEDSVDTRVAKLHLDFDDHGQGRGQGPGDVTFEIRPGSQPVVHELVNQGPPSQRPHFLRAIDVATVPVASELDTTLRDLIRGVAPNPEDWDDRNWVDDVLRVLQAAWPSQIHNCDVTYALNFMVDVLYHG